MAQTPEKKVKDAVRKLLTEFGIYYFMPAANGFGRAGIPDIICCFGGRFIAIECKAGKGVTTALQDRELAAIRTAGGMAMVINETNIDELKEKLQWMR
jgi:Holliday junction resolvase